MDVLFSYPWKRQCFCLLPLMCVLGVTVFILGTGNDPTLYFKTLHKSMPVLTIFIKYAGEIINFAAHIVYIAIFSHALYCGKHPLARWSALCIAGQICFSFLLVQGLKISFGHPRPYAALEGAGVIPFSLAASQHSFPSGHTTVVALAAYSLAARYGRIRFSLLMGLFPALVGFCRIYTGDHYVSDVFAGSIIGLLGSFCIHFCHNRLNSRRQ